MADQAKDEWEKAMSELAQEEPELLQHFHKLSQAAGKVGEKNIEKISPNVLPTLAALAFFMCLSLPSKVCELDPAGTDVASQQEFTSCLKNTLSGLAKNANNLQVGYPFTTKPGSN